MTPDLFALPAVGAHLIAVRRDGARSRVEAFTDFDTMMEAARQYLWNDDVAWCSLNERDRRGVRQTHLVTRDRNGDVVITEQAGRLDRVRRGKEKRSPGTDHLG